MAGTPSSPAQPGPQQARGVAPPHSCLASPAPRAQDFRGPTTSSPRDAAGPEPPTTALPAPFSAALPPAFFLQIPTQPSSLLHFPWKTRAWSGAARGGGGGSVQA